MVNNLPILKLKILNQTITKSSMQTTISTEHTTTLTNVKIHSNAYIIRV